MDYLPTACVPARRDQVPTRVWLRSLQAGDGNIFAIWEDERRALGAVLGPTHQIHMLMS